MQPDSRSPTHELMRKSSSISGEEGDLVTLNVESLTYEQRAELIVLVNRGR